MKISKVTKNLKKKRKKKCEEDARLNIQWSPLPKTQGIGGIACSLKHHLVDVSRTGGISSVLKIKQTGEEVFSFFQNFANFASFHDFPSFFN